MFARPARSILTLCTAAVLAGSSSTAAAQTVGSDTTARTPEARAAAIVGPSIVYLEQHWRAWVKIPRASELIYFQGYVNDGYPFEWATRCTGFIVSPTGYIATAGHCVDPGAEGARDTALRLAVAWLAQQGYIYRRDAAYWLTEAHGMWGVEGSEKGSDPDLEVYAQRGVAAGGLKTGEAYPARLVDYRPLSEGDAALLKIEASDLPTVLVAPAVSITIGTPVLSVGYPGSTDQVTDASYEPTYKDGQINAQKTREGGLVPVYEVSAAMSGGMSGGPTVNLEGELVGVNSFGIVGETEAFNFITPSSIVLEMLTQNGVTNELGPVDVAYREAVDAFFGGDYRRAAEKLDEVLAISPTHQQAQDLKVEASRLAQQQVTASAAPERPAGGGFPAVAIAGIVAAVLVLGGLAITLSRRTRRAPAPTEHAVGAPPQTAQAADFSRAVGFQPPAAETSGPGVAAAPSPERPRFCPSCGHALEPDARFCPACGRAVQA